MVKYTSKLLEISLRLHSDVVNGPDLMSIGQLINPFCSLCPTTRYISALVAKLAGGTGCYEAYSKNFTCFETCCSNRKESPPIDAAYEHHHHAPDFLTVGGTQAELDALQ